MGPRLNPTLVPTVPVALDQAHPLAMGLVALYVPGASWNDLSGVNGALTPGTGTLVSTARGTGWFTNTLADAATAVIAPSAQLTQNISTFWLGAILGAAGGAGLPWVWGSDNVADSERQNMIYLNGTTNLQIITNNGVGGANSFTSIGGSIPTGVFSAAVTQGPTGAGFGPYSAYINGVTTASGSVNQGSSYSSNLLYFGGNANAVGLMGAWWNAPLPANIIAWLAAEPFALLRPIVRRSYYHAPAGEIITADKWYQPPAQPRITRPDLIPY
jgi:hypothetical protein